MKKYRKWFPLIMVLLMVLSWYMLISGKKETADNYNALIESARANAQKTLTKQALNDYEAAMEIKDNTDLWDEVLEYLWNRKEKELYYKWCNNYLEKYPYSVSAYEFILRGYVNDKKYTDTWDYLDTAEKRGVTSDYIENVRKELRYEYAFDVGTYSDVSVYNNNFCAVNNAKYWGYVNRKGGRAIASQFVSAGLFSSKGYAPVKDQDGEVYYIDKTGDKVMVCEEPCLDLGFYIENCFAVKKANGKYVYMNNDWQELSEEYDFASTMNGGVAAVCIGKEWTLIGQDFKELSSNHFSNVKFDEKGICYRNERCFASETADSYVMIDNQGNKIGDLSFADAKIFYSGDPAAVKIDDKWCFVNKEGELNSDKKYDDARSFCNELAAVCINGKWGFVNTDEELVIAAEFDDAKDFNDLGSCFVKQGENWKLIKLYRLNRE